jgi:hypothetical protein
MLERGLSFIDQVRDRRNDLMHSLYMFDEETVFATKIKSVKIDGPAQNENQVEYKRVKQELKLRVGSLKKLISTTNLLAQDFRRAIGHLRQKSSIKKAFLCSMGGDSMDRDFSVPEIGEKIT